MTPDPAVPARTGSARAGGITALMVALAACAAPQPRDATPRAAIAVPVAAAAGAATASTPVDAGAAARAPSRLADLRQPRSGLYTGGQPQPGAWGDIAAGGVGTVINLRTDAEQPGRDEASEVRAAGMAYHHLPIAGGDDLTPANASRLWSLIEHAGGPVLVHCASGNRAGALLSIAAARDGGMPAEEALALGRRAGMASAEARARAVLQVPPACADATAC